MIHLRRLHRHTLTTALAILLAASGHGRSAELVDGVAAVANGKVITHSEVRNAVAVRAQVLAMGYRGTQSQLEQEIEAIRKEALNDLIERELILDAFYRQGGSIRTKYVDDSINTFIRERFDGDRQEFITELQKTGITLKNFRKMREEALIIQYMRQNHTGTIPPPTPSEREQWYRENQDRFREKDYVKLRTLTISKYPGDSGTTIEGQKALTTEIRQKILDGADFATMAKTYSVDSKKLEGGDWGTIERGDLKDLLSDEAFRMKAETVSSVLEDERNYYLLYVDAIQRGNVTPLSEVDEEVDKFVMQQKRKAAHDKWLARLRKEASVTIEGEGPMAATSTPALDPSSDPPRIDVTKPSVRPAETADNEPEKTGLFKKIKKIIPGI